LTVVSNAAVTAGLALVLAACGGGGNTSATKTVTVTVSGGSTPSAAATTTFPSTTPTSGPGIGDPMTNGGVKLTVNAVSAPATVLLHQYHNPGVEFADTPPKAGAKYIRVDTTIENVGKESLFLTCGNRIRTQVIDSQQRQFDTIEYLFDIKGNPECKAVQPGFTSPMTYVFEVAQDAVVVYFAFADRAVDSQNLTLMNIANYVK
jgi:hypothetical protein